MPARTMKHLSGVALPLLTAGKAAWTCGRFEVRARVPCGKGTWPAIWLLNSAVDGDFGGEADHTLFPVPMEVDHVRVYQCNHGAP